MQAALHIWEACRGLAKADLATDGSAAPAAFSCHQPSGLEQAAELQGACSRPPGDPAAVDSAVPAAFSHLRTEAALALHVWLLFLALPPLPALFVSLL